MSTEIKQLHTAARLTDLLDYDARTEQWRDAIFAAHALSMKTRFVLLAMVDDAVVGDGRGLFQVTWPGMADKLGLPFSSVAQAVREAGQLGIILNPRDPEMPDTIVLNDEWLKSVRMNADTRRGFNI